MPISSHRAARLLQTGMALSSELSLPALLQQIVESAAELTGARYAALGVIGDGGHELVDFLTTGVSEAERTAIGDPPHGRGILGALIDDATVLRLRDLHDDPRSVGFPPNHPPMRSFLGAPLRALGRAFGNLYLTEKQGADEFTEEDEEVLTILAAQAGVAVANARLYAETRRRENLLQASHQITTATLAGAESDAVLRLVCERARELVSATLASLVAPDDDDPVLSVRVSVGDRADQILGLAIPSEGSVSGDVIRTGRPVVLDDASGDERAFQPMVGAVSMGPAVFVPLAIRGAAFGSLAVARDRGGPRFGPEDVRILEGFAAQAAIAVEFARARRELQRLALVDERERIAKELHDGVIQALFAVGLGLQGAAALVGEPRLATRIQEAVNEIDRVIGDLRNYIFGLRPGVLAGGRIGEALHQLAHEFEARTGVVTVVDLDVTLEAALAQHAVHIVQLTREALSNVGRHAGAVTCRVSLHREDGRAVLEVDDDGRGFEVLAQPREGMGMSNLRNRAQSMGGDFSIQSVPDEGTTVRVAIPV